MLNPRTLALVFVAGFVVLRVLSRIATRRGPRPRKRAAVVESRVDFREKLFVGLFLIGGLISPLLALTPWLARLRYALPDWVSWTGVVIMAAASGLHWRAHADLGRNYSATVRVRDNNRSSLMGCTRGSATRSMHRSG